MAVEPDRGGRGGEPGAGQAGAGGGTRPSYVFVTGQLAKPALERTLAGMRPPFDWRVAALRIKVAALLTTGYLKAALKETALGNPGCDAVYIPGLSRADTETLERHFGRPFRKGPKDLRDLPEFFGGDADAYDPDGPHELTILAEINDVDALGDREILDGAERYRRAGADVIDLGCSPERPIPDLGRIVRLLRREGHRVSIDTFDEREALSGDGEGAEFLLSLNSTNMHLAGRLASAVPVVIPDPGRGVPSLLRNVEEARRRGAPKVIADAVLDPIHFGFAESIRRFCEARAALPEADFLMGVGNLTELTEADTTGINAVLAGVMSELKVRYALTTEVAHWARGSVRELDCARRIMRHARARGALPKGFDARLLTTRDARARYPGEDELRAVQAKVTDRNFRIDTDGESVFVYNNERFVRGASIRDIFPQLGVEDDAPHAFYLGRELMKADIARHLGKKYIQGEPLDWGYLTWQEEEGGDHARRG
jgi:dihydropteroate synthase